MESGNAHPTRNDQVTHRASDQPRTRRKDGGQAQCHGSWVTRIRQCVFVRMAWR